MSRRGAPTARWVVPPDAASAAQADEEAIRKLLTDARPRFIVRRPDVPEVEIEIDKNEFAIGRSPALADLVLDDDLVSRHHATLKIDARGYFVLQDHDSKNGMVFQERPTRRLNLHDGDTFLVGRTELEFRAELTRLQAPPPSVDVDDSVMAAAARPAPDPNQRRSKRKAASKPPPAAEAPPKAPPRPDSEAESDVDGA